MRRLAKTLDELTNAGQELGGDTTEVRLQILAEIRRVVSFDAYAWLLTDPITSVGSSPLADVPCLPELPQAIRLKYQTPVNRWTALHSPPAASLHQTTGGDLSLSVMWRELLADFDVTDIASIVFRDPFGCWGFLDLWRIGQQPEFTSQDLELIAGAAAPITTVLRRCQAAALAIKPPRPTTPAGPFVLLTAADLTVQAQTPETEDLLRTMLPAPSHQPPIPAAAYNVAAQLLAIDSGVDANLPLTRLHLRDGQWITVRAAHVAPPSGAELDIAVTIEETAAHERAVIFGLAFGLSPRENELLRRLCSGADTRELAHQMAVTEHTIQDHLKSMFDKTATRSRSSLISRALAS